MRNPKLALCAVLILTVSCKGDDTDVLPCSDDSLAGTTVTLIGPFTDQEAAAVVATVRAFEDCTGVDVDYQPAGGDIVEQLVAQLESGFVSDVAMIPQPGFVTYLADNGDLVELGTFIDEATAEAAFSGYLLDLVSTDAGLWGGWYRLDAKSLIWYAADDFGTAGYQVPETWGELITLSDQMVTDGETPWCMGWGSESATGWPGTDWVEDIMLRTAGMSVYDQWVAHDIPFNDSQVKDAFEVLGEILFTDDYVLGGHANVPSVNFWELPGPLFEDPPGCWMFRQASFVQNMFPPSAVYDTDVAAFAFPSIDDGVPPAMLGGGVSLVVLADRPEVRAFMEYMFTAEATIEAARTDPGFISPHLGFDTSNYLEPAQFVQGEAMMAALENDGYRFDASDLMPPEVGAAAFWTGMVDYATGGPDNLDTVLATIEAAWPTE